MRETVGMSGRAEARGGRGGRIGRKTTVRRGFSALLAAFLCVGEGGGVALALTVKNVTARQRWPWNNLVDIDYEIEGAGAGADLDGLYLRFEVVSPTGGWTNTAAALDPEPALMDGRRRVTWNPAADGFTNCWSSDTVCRAVLRRDDPDRYMALDLSGGPSAVSYPVTNFPAMPPGGWTDEYKTTKLVMRKIDPGTFTMGEGGNARSVTLTEPFYIGVFEVTQKQWELVMGTAPAAYPGTLRPVEKVSYNAIRGSAEEGFNWPSNGYAVSGESFMGIVRKKARLEKFDLPTGAQWEYACRAGTVTDLNNGKTATSAALGEVARYYYNQTEGRGGYSTGHTAAGCYLPNAWGLYDMHGNVWEWCLDWEGDAGPGAENPAGPEQGTKRIRRGGSWTTDELERCRSAYQYGNYPDIQSEDFGFRPVCFPPRG